MFFTRLGFALVLLVIVGAEETPSRISCDQPGVITNGKSKEFQICSKDPDGKLTLKTLSCGDNSYFSEEKRKCVSNDSQGETKSSFQSTSSEESNELETQSRLGGSISKKNGLSSKRYYTVNSWCPKAMGRFCNSCNSAVSCINNRVVAVTNCGANRICDARSNRCTNETIPECEADYSFTCTGMGIFPDPHFCNRYHFCQKANANPLTFGCQYNYVYDFVNEECNYSSSQYPSYFTPCPIFPKCTEDLQVGGLPGNGKIYFACIADGEGKIRRMLFKCPRNQVFVTDQCR